MSGNAYRNIELDRTEIHKLNKGYSEGGLRSFGALSAFANKHPLGVALIKLMNLSSIELDIPIRITTHQW